MANTDDRARESERFGSLLKGVAKNLLEKVYGPRGMPWGTKFNDLENVAVDFGKALSREMINQALAKQSDEEVPEELAACCRCGGRGKMDEDEPLEPRIVTTRAGDAEWREPRRYCKRCRRAFFPSVQKLGDRSGQP